MGPTPSTLYQHGWPRRVKDESIMSSATKSQAWSISMIQPSTAKRHKSSFVTGLPWASKSTTPVSTTIKPRFILPPMQL